MGFGEIKGQEKAIRLLRRSLEDGRLAHAYLFHGPEGVGKELTARNFAKLLNCSSPRNGDACDRCVSCRSVQKGSHPDLIWLRPRGKARIIPIGDYPQSEGGTVRGLRNALGMKPYMGKWKVGIIAEAHALQRDGANALLKTLEEPPSHTVILMITSRPDMLLPTILSRCQAVRFEAMPQAVLAEMLRSEYSLDEAEAALISRLTGGRMGEAIRFVRQGRAAEARELAEMLAGHEHGYWDGVAGPLELMEKSIARAGESLEWELAEKSMRSDEAEETGLEEEREAFTAGETRKRQEELFGDLLAWYRDLLVWKNTGSAELIMSAGGQRAVARAAERMSVSRIERDVRRIEAAARSLRLNADFHTVMENLLVQLSAEAER